MLFVVTTKTNKPSNFCILSFCYMRSLINSSAGKGSFCLRLALYWLALTLCPFLGHGPHSLFPSLFSGFAVLQHDVRYFIFNLILLVLFHYANFYHALLGVVIDYLVESIPPLLPAGIRNSAYHLLVGGIVSSLIYRYCKTENHEPLRNLFDFLNSFHTIVLAFICLPRLPTAWVMGLRRKPIPPCTECVGSKPGSFNHGSVLLLLNENLISLPLTNADLLLFLHFLPLFWRGGGQIGNTVHRTFNYILFLFDLNC